MWQQTNRRKEPIMIKYINILPLIIPKLTLRATERFVNSMNKVVYDVPLSEISSSLSVKELFTDSDSDSETFSCNTPWAPLIKWIFEVTQVLTDWMNVAGVKKHYIK